MKAFEVRLNGKLLCVAGIGRDGVLDAIVDYVGDRRGSELTVSVGGLITPRNEHVRWVPRKRLRLGDEVRVALVERASVDKPISRHRGDQLPQPSVGDIKRFVRQKAKEFGWTITATRKPK